MQIRNRYPVNTLPQDAQFLLGTSLAKEVNNILYLYISNQWVSQHKSLHNYNQEIITEPHELSLSGIYRYIRYTIKASNIKGKCYLFINHKGEYRLSTYYKPVIKGWTIDKNPIYKAGETIYLDVNIFPQLQELKITTVLEIDDIFCTTLLNNTKARLEMNIVMNT